MAKTILLADDSVTIQKVVELTFMDEDFEVAAVGSGNEALDWLQQARPDLVIADVHMPGSDGYSVCEQAKARYDGLPVLLLVGTFEPFDEGRATAVGADGHLKKPFDAQDLLGQVSRLTAGASNSTEPAPPAVDEPLFEFDEPTQVAPSAEVYDNATRVFRAHDAPSVDDTTDPSTARVDLADLTPDPVPLGVPLEAVPLEAVPLEAVPLETVPLETVPPETVPPETVPPETVPPETVPPETVPLETVAIGTISQEDVPPAPTFVEPTVTPVEPTVTPTVATPEPVNIAAEGESDDASEVTAEIDIAAVASARTEAAERQASDESVPTNGNGFGSLSDEDVERIARRVAELVGDQAVREVAWEVVPDLAEVVIKERIRELESQLE